MGSLNNLVLVLNKVWVPIRVIKLKRAIKLIFSDRASIVNEIDFSVFKWDDWINLSVSKEDVGIETTRGKIKIPEVVILLKYDKIAQNNKMRLTKKNIFFRDNFTCQYSGKKLKKSECDIDHVIPKSKGGKNSWDNMVVCSKEINRKKGNKTIHEAGLRLIRKPFTPKKNNLFFLDKNNIPKSWFNFIRGEE